MSALWVRLVLCALIGLTAIDVSCAQESRTPPALLTPATVENFIASYPVIKGKADELREQYEMPAATSDVAAWRAWADVKAVQSQLDAAVRGYGFEDFPTWVRVLSVTAQSYAFTQSGENLDRRMAEALAKVESDPSISDSQKELIRQQLWHSTAAIAAMRPSQASIDAVKPYAEQLGRLFDQEGEVK